jgi:acetyl-CoA carboxylase biotin carboxyl carrier protein
MERRADPVGLVARRDDHDRPGGGGCVGHRDYSAAHPNPRRKLTRMADIEAHITGTVWKIEVAVGDEVADGDTVVILESMKMEMPVEAEDDGTVSEIKCEEGQSVQEGEVLVVLE